MSDRSQGPGWWQASDGRWYPPEQAPGGPPPDTSAWSGAPGGDDAPSGGPGGPRPGGPPPSEPPPPMGPPPGGPPPGGGAPGGPPPPYAAPGGHAAQHGGVPAGGGAVPQGQLAQWGQRAVAFLIDWAILVVGFIVVLIVGAIFFAIADVLGVLVQTIGYLIVTAGGFYFYYLNGATGQSPGKRLTGLKVIGEASGQPIGGGLGIVRGLAHFLDSIICYIGWLFPLWDEKRQTIADKVMKTVVVTGVPKQELGPDLFKP